MNIAPLAADIEPLKLSDWITAVGTVVALGMSAFALWWQRRLQEQQLKHDLYQKRFDCQEVLLRCLHLKVMAPVAPIVRLWSPRDTMEDKLDKLCEDFEFYSTSQIRELFVVLLHIENLFDPGTVKLVRKLGDAVQNYRYKLGLVIDSFQASQQIEPGQILQLKEEKEAISQLAAILIPHLDASLKLYQEPWWIRLRHKVDSWEDTVTNDTPDTKNPPPAN